MSMRATQKIALEPNFISGISSVSLNQIYQLVGVLLFELSSHYSTSGHPYYIKQ